VLSDTSGIGTGLAGIVCTLSGAEETVISDYPAKEILANIKINLEKNVPARLRSKVSVEGHEWGVLTDAYAQSKRNYFTRILAADCLWMPWQHENLVKSMLHFLSYDIEARIWVIAGFHTGRAKLAPFFKVAVDCGLDIEAIWERDCDGKEREWAEERDGGREDVTERKKWLVIAILQRSQISHTIQNIVHQ
jgi:nicotinamide N-methyltransferase